LIKKKLKPKQTKITAKPKQSKKMANRKSPSGSPSRPDRTPTPDPAYQQAVQNYEAALKAFQAHKFDKAKVLLEKVMTGPNRQLADRAKVHLNACNQQLGRTSNSFKSPEEQYDYSVSLMNMGDFVAAREQLEGLLRKNSKLDFVWYGLAVLECLTGHFPEALKNLTEAIRLNPGNRFQARNDSDFKHMADDPRFTELLYPEGAAMPS
jgi:tetratricopeptide (TPR) repeat protein